MSDFQRNTILRFAVVFTLIALGFLAVLVQIIIIQTKERDQWLLIAESQVLTNQPIPATRGNILDCNGKLLASSMPEYYIQMDARVEALHLKNGELFYRYVDSIATGLSHIVGDHSAAEYKHTMKSAFQANDGKGKTVYLTKHRLTYTQMKDAKQLPLICRGVYKSGITFVAQHRRVKPFGSLASRTIGSIYGENGAGNAGLEKGFDTELAGKNGISSRQRVGGRWENIPIVQAKDGLDVLTTIDTDLQDIVESNLRNKLVEVNADWGCCILMETSTGHIKAIANLDRTANGSYEELMNHAVTRVEPGSTFKTISLAAVLDDGKETIDDTVSVCKGTWCYLNKNSKHFDAHPRDTIYSIRSALAVSSNIAFAKIVTRSYDGSAEKFVKRISKIGVMDSLYYEVPGAQQALIQVPKDNVTVSKMAYGYSVLLTPMQLLMFYNGIANNGRMVKPMLVTHLLYNGEVVEEFDTEVVRSSMCKASTIQDLKKCLHDVVWDNYLGTASVRAWKGHICEYKAQSDLVHIAGKTGTAQMLINGHYSGRDHRMTFVGYFPEENPQYTCICMIEHPHKSGYDAGYDCGGVVRRIAEKTIAYSDCYEIVKDTLILNKR